MPEFKDFYLWAADHSAAIRFAKSHPLLDDDPNIPMGMSMIVLEAMGLAVGIPVHEGMLRHPEAIEGPGGILHRLMVKHYETWSANIPAYVMTDRPPAYRRLPRDDEKGNGEG